MSTDVTTTDRCLDPEVLGALAEGRLPRGEMPAALAHLERCADCTELFETAMALKEPERATWSRPWLAVAAAVALLVVTAPLVLRSMRRDPIAGLVRLAPRDARAVEPRLSGGFAWAPFRAPERGDEPASGAQRMKLVGAAGDLVERAEADKGAAAQHAAGVALVLAEKPEEGMARLQSAAERAPSDAKAWSDLAAAEYMTALRAGTVSLYPVALAHADRALRIDGRSAEALFNRALIVERLGLAQAARDAWERYLRVDPSSPWADEARAHLKGIPATTSELQFKNEWPRLERAAADGDQASVDAIVDRFPEQSRAFAEAETLGRWGEAVLRGDGIAAARELTTARAAGRSLVRRSGESLLHDAVEAIDRGAETVALANAHVTYRRGRIAYSRRQPEAAETDLRAAGAQFRQGHSPMSLVARYYAANTRFDRNDVAGARGELEALHGESRLAPQYIALGAQIRWELALCAMTGDDWAATTLYAADAARDFRRLGENSSAAFMDMMRATALMSLGQPDAAWTVRIEGFRAQSAEGRADRLPVSIGDAARVELRAGRLDPGRALLAIEEAAHRAAGDDAQVSNALVRRAVIDAAMGERADAPREAAEAMTVAQRVGDPALRARAVADAQFALGSAVLEEDPRRARLLLTQAIDHYRATGKAFYLAEAYLLRARAELRLRETDDALRDLGAGVAETDGHRASIAGPILGTGVVDARRALLQEIVALRLDRGDVDGAFTDAERARLSLSEAVQPATLGALRAKLAGSDTAVLELFVLSHEVVAFCVTAGGATVSRTRFVSLGTGDAELYDLLVRPSAATLGKARRLIIVADRPLHQVSFPALLDTTTNRRLIEMMPVAMAASATSLRPRRGGPRAMVATLALPAGEGGTVALAEEEGELAEVRRFYPASLAVEPSLAALRDARADVLHIAGHTARQPGSGEAALLFRAGGSGVEAVTWSRVASMKLDSPVVVLAACETLRETAAPNTHSLSLGGGFLAAGASAAIGTLTPIADNEARAFFRSLHRELARGLCAPDALQRADLEAMAARSPVWRSVAVLTNTIDLGT